MPIAPLVRRLTPVDAATWRDIRLEALATAPEAFASRHSDWVGRPLADFARRIEGAAVFVATLGPEAVGCAVLSRDDDPARDRRGWVEAVFVRPAARGRGVADALLAAIAAEANRLGMSELLLDVGAANHAARRAYARAGFTALAERPPGSDRNCEVTLLRALP